MLKNPIGTAYCSALPSTARLPELHVRSLLIVLQEQVRGIVRHGAVMRLCILLLPRCNKQPPTSRQQSSPAGGPRCPSRASCARSLASCGTTPRRRLCCRVSVPPSGRFTSRQAESSAPAGLHFAMVGRVVMRYQQCGGGALLIQKQIAWSSHHNPAGLGFY